MKTEQDDIPIDTLLIVPYGIETSSTRQLQQYYHRLLIVPYGIETINWIANKGIEELLIVPYGIETGITEDNEKYSVIF